MNFFLFIIDLNMKSGLFVVPFRKKNQIELNR